MDLIDPFGRTIRDLRISVTDRCNFRCTYCMPEEGMKWLPRSDVLTFEEMERLARIFVERFEVDGLRLTGGEPTVRAHLPVLVGKLAQLVEAAEEAAAGDVKDLHSEEQTAADAGDGGDRLEEEGDDRGGEDPG